MWSAGVLECFSIGSSGSQNSGVEVLMNLTVNVVHILVLLSFKVLHHSNTTPLQHYATPTLRHSNTTPLQHYATPTLRHSNTTLLQHSATPTLHHSDTPSLPSLQKYHPPHHGFTPRCSVRCEAVQVDSRRPQIGFDEVRVIRSSRHGRYRL